MQDELAEGQNGPPEIFPAPVPVLLNVRVAKKFAVTNLALSMVTVQVVADPLQAPLQPLNIAPALGVAVNVTTVLGALETVHVPGQLIPPPVTIPGAPVVTDTVNGGLGLVKLAVTLLAVLMVTVQVPVPEQSPLQPVKVEPTSGAADKVSV